MMVRILAVLALAAGSLAGWAHASSHSGQNSVSKRPEAAPEEFKLQNSNGPGAPCPQLFNDYDALTSHVYSALETALQRFGRDLAGKRGRSEARSSKPKEIVVVGSKIKDVVRSPRARPGGFGSVSGLGSSTDIVEFREGGPASLPKLKSAIRSFERAAGPRSPCVRTCKAAQRRCLARCRRALRAGKIKGRCVCEHEHARCLVQAARRGECVPPDLR